MRQCLQFQPRILKFINTMSLEREQHKCRICLEHTTEMVSAHDQVVAGGSHLGITLKLTNQLKLDGSSDELLHICVPCANMAKTTYNIKEPSEEVDYKLEIEEEIIIEENFKAVKIKEETVTSNFSSFSQKEEIDIVNEMEDGNVTIEVAPEVYYEESCDKTLNYRRKLRSHSRVVDMLDKLQCDYCEYTPESLNDYTMHIKAEHANDRSKTLKDHLRSHSEIKKYECKDCEAKYASRSSLSNHMKRNKHGPKHGKHNTLRSNIAYEDEVGQVTKTYACKICDKQFSSSSSLRLHSKVVHNLDDKSCYFCAFLPKSRQELRNHVKQEHADRKLWACKHCGNTYFELQHLKMHLPTHNGIMGNHMCNVCDYKACFKSLLVKHMRKHTGEKPFSCLKCDRKYCSNQDLKNHMKTHQWGDSVTSNNETVKVVKFVAQQTLDTYVCKSCNKQFAHHSSLRKHIDGIHYAQISCYYCEYMPTSSKDSERHIKKEHADKKYFACDQCDETFFSVQNLTTHMLLHCGTKNYDCKICNFECKRKSYLIRHLRKHTGERPFQCSNCGKFFKHNQSLKVHLAHQRCGANHKDKKQAHIEHAVIGARSTYACKICEKTCRFSSQVREHTRRVHKITDTSCFFCDYMPASKYDLRRHSEAQHADKKTISCEHCDKRFFEEANLLKHLTGHKLNHVCKICGSKFPTNSNLIEHMAIHIGEESKCSL